jgi:CHAD domain-containing protein
LPRLGDPQVALPAAELHDVKQFLIDRRSEAQLPIIACAEKLPQKKMERRLTRMVHRIRWRGMDGEPTVCQAGRRHILEEAEEFGAAAEAATAGGSMESLHQLRIAGKRLRYTIELFACVADDLLRQSVYPHVEELQDRLGKINDHVAAERYYRACAQSVSAPGLKGSFNRLANHELQSISVSVDVFRRGWNPQKVREIQAGALNAFPPPSAA